ALLAAMGILLGIGAAFTGGTTIEMFPFLGNSFLQGIFNFMIKIRLYLSANLFRCYAQCLSYI
ncbi:MAG: hypothetical protein RSC68_20230, partial [Acinetobacter sp.]